jgi:hypothetical protein
MIETALRIIQTLAAEHSDFRRAAARAESRPARAEH